MRFDDIHQIITTSKPDDWNLVEPRGPIYQMGWLYGEADGASFLEPREHAETAAYRENVSLALAWGMDADPSDSRRRSKMEPDWASHLPDSRVHPFFVEVLWNGTLIDRHIGMSVDGGGAYLPDPEVHYDDSTPGQAAVVGHSITPWQRAFFWLIHSFHHRPDDFERYRERVGFFVSADE